ncbi:extracellular solute-binding protein [Paenibacillus lemnae]|uniref:Extracellular solute-binding protein n=1 Tax=Paenibacillus lemnae TaxID=1330551 RepID=A0A848M488_PAELE|nr:extracellular solute-binding protein [Paenibacillus lemnae]NMO94623.1 extracellular solute-binding protein [Paenibacillus lemnae]
MLHYISHRTCRRRNNYRILSSMLLFTVLLSGCTGPDSTPALSFSADVIRTDWEQELTKVKRQTFEPYYMQRLSEWKASGAGNGSETIEIPAADVARSSKGAGYSIGSYGGRDDVLIWNNESSHWLEYEIQVDSPGLYELSMTYHSFQNSDTETQNYRPSVMAVQLNGEFPFREARAVSFPKRFRDQLPLKQDQYGDDIRPRPEEITGWMEMPFQDSEGAYTDPLLWYLEQGTHKIRLQSFDSIVMDSIQLKPPTELESYEQVRNAYPSNNSGSTEVITIEAELMDSKNDVSLQMAVDHDSLVTPKSKGKQIFNAVGGTRWEQGGEEITWSFDVPASGLYNIAVRALQGYQSNKRVFRTISVDGKVPFQELSAYPFAYSSAWQGVELAGPDGQPYEIYLESGKHTISMTATYAPFNPVLKDLQEALDVLNQLSRDLHALTGGEEDTNRTWDIENQFPEFPKRISLVSKHLQIMEGDLIAVNGKEDNHSQSIRASIRDLEDMLEFPNDIPYKRDRVAAVQQKLSSIQQPLTQAPLMLDKMYVVPVGSKAPRMTANFWERSTNGAEQFALSFDPRDQLTAGDEKVVNVWMNYGRDYVNVMQDLADQYFTPETGIPVRVDLLPQEDLLVMANAAGKVPDIAIGLTEGRPVEMAIRGAALDLSQYPDFDQVASQFAPGALLPYYYDGEYYALPETQKFNVLFYRKDILAELGLSVPDTWDDVMEMLPTLQQNGYDFNIPQDYLTFIYQNGAEFYNKDGMTTALDSPEGFKAFKQYTDFYSLYGVEKQVPSFYQHFRDGRMPIGLGDFNMFLQLSVAAPELSGWWGIAPLPGIEQEDGTIARWSGGGQQAAMIFKKSKNQDEAWKFMQWWMSAATQERFGSDLEGFYGITFRWNTANIEAFSRLPWQTEELNVFLEQWRWYKDMAHIPGSYLVPRELNNAWNRTVLDGQNYRSSLEEAVLNINREFRRKAIEFDYIDEDGKVLRTYSPPIIDTPWEGADKYAK